MKLTKNKCLRGAGRKIRQNPIAVMLIAMMALVATQAQTASAQAVSTTTVQGTVYLANGQAGSGTLHLSWPAFTTANGQAVAADGMNVKIAPDGFVSVNLAPNQGATPAGQYYTAVFYMSDGTISTQYWVVPSAAQASLAQVQSQVMPAAQAVQAVSKAYVDQAIQELDQGVFTLSGGTMSGPLLLNGDPTQTLQAADKHYVDSAVSLAVPLTGGNMTGALGALAVNGVEAPVAGSSQTTLQAAVSAAGTSGAMEIPPTYAGTDGFTNPNGVRVTDLRTNGAQQAARSVKEFGAVCDGVTDDTNALQAALNYGQTHGVALTIPQGTCKTRTLYWHGESIGGMGKQVSALLGFPGQDVLTTITDSPNLLQFTRLHDLTIYVDQSADVSCSPAEGRAAAGGCAISRLLENNSIFSRGGSGLTGTLGTGIGWAVGNCAIAMPASMGTGGNGLKVAEMENVEIATTGVDPMAAQYPGVHSTHTCGMYLAQWPQWSEFRNIDIRGVNTGIAMPALPGPAPAGLNADSNRWQNITIQATHGFVAATGSNNVLDNVVVMAGNSSAAGEPPTGLVLDLVATQQSTPQGWTVRNAVVIPSWNAVQPQLTVTAAVGAVTGVTTGSEHGLGFDPYGLQVPLKFSGSCTAAATANVNADGSIGTISVTQGGTGCSGTTTASVNVAGNWDTAAAVNLIGGQNMTFFAGNLLKGNGGYTVWNAAGSTSYGTQLSGGGGTLPGGGSYSALVANNRLGTTYQVDQFPGADFGAKLQSCLSAVSPQYGGNCDARNFTGNQSMGSNLTISTANTTVQLPCATIATANQIVVTAGTRNVALRGCALRGGSVTSGSQGGTVLAYSGTGGMVQVGDPTYAVDTQGFHMDDVVINTTAATSATAQGLAAYRTQEMDLESLYFLGNANQTGMTLDGTGNYTGGTYFDNAFNGFQTAVNAIGHQVSNAAITDWMNASAFVRLHIDCPTSGGSPIAGTYGINLQQGDGNTFTGGDVEGCATALHLGPNAQNNTIVGLRNENSNSQVVADAGSSYNNWMTGGTMFTGKLTDNGTRNSFLDTFHRSFNGMNGDWYGSQQDATVTNHYRIGTGMGNERGLLNRYQTDYGYRWTTGLSDATVGEQFYQVLDELNNVYRLSIGQYNNGQPGTNNQTVVNAAGTGAVVLNGSSNAGTGGVVFGSGGSSASSVATINNAGNAQFNGTLQVGGTSTFLGTTSAKNQADAEIDEVLWAGATTSQKESLTYKDWNGNSQWYAMKDTSNNWALNSATGGLDSFKAYQSTNSGDTYVNASNASGAVRVNYESGAGTTFKVYGGSSSSLYASFAGAASIQFPGLAAGSGHSCLQIDNSGYVTNTGAACGSGSGGSGTVGSANSGQIAYYTGNGTSVGGITTVPVAAGGTGAATPASALANLQGLPSQSISYMDARSFGAICNWTGTSGNDDTVALQSAVTSAIAAGRCVYIPANQTCHTTATIQVNAPGLCVVGANYLTSVIDSQFSGPIFTLGTFQTSPSNVYGGPAQGYVFRDVTLKDSQTTGTSYVGTRTTIGIQDNGSGSADLENVGFNGLKYGFEGTYGSDFDRLRTIWGNFNDVTVYLGPNSQQFVIDALISGLDAESLVIAGAGHGTITGFESGDNYISSMTFENMNPQRTGVTLPGTNDESITVDGSWFETGAGWGESWQLPRQVLFQSNTGDPSYPRNVKFTNTRVVQGETGLPAMDSNPHPIFDVESGKFLTFEGLLAEGDRYKSVVYVGNNGGLYGGGILTRNYRVADGNTATMPVYSFASGVPTWAGYDYQEDSNRNVHNTPNLFPEVTNTTPLVYGRAQLWADSTLHELEAQYNGDSAPRLFAYRNLSSTFTAPQTFAGIGMTGTLSNSDSTVSGLLAAWGSGSQGHWWVQNLGSPTTDTVLKGSNGSGASTILLDPVAGTGSFNGGVGGNGYTWLPTALTGYHGTSGTKVQLSDGTGTSGDCVKYAADGSITDAGAACGTGLGDPGSNGILKRTALNTTAVATAHDASSFRECSASGSANTYSCATTPTFTPAAGDEILLNVNVANTATSTLAINGGSAYTIYKNGGTLTLASGDLQANHWVSAIFDSSNHWQLEGQLGNTTATGLSAASTLPNGTAVTTQPPDDNSGKTASTAYVKSPGAIAPTTVTASGIVTGGNDTTRTTTATMTNSWTTTGLVLPTVPASTIKVGRCVVFWQMSSTSYTATFGFGMTNSPTNLWGATKVVYAAAGTQNYLSFTQTATTATAISTAATAGVTNTTYEAAVDFTIQTGSSNTVGLTLFGETNNSGATLTIEPGSACSWLP